MNQKIKKKKRKFEREETFKRKNRIAKRKEVEWKRCKQKHDTNVLCQQIIGQLCDSCKIEQHLNIYFFNNLSSSYHQRKKITYLPSPTYSNLFVFVYFNTKSNFYFNTAHGIQYKAQSKSTQCASLPNDRCKLDIKQPRPVRTVG